MLQFLKNGILGLYYQENASRVDKRGRFGVCVSPLQSSSFIVLESQYLTKCHIQLELFCRLYSWRSYFQNLVRVQGAVFVKREKVILTDWHSRTLHIMSSDDLAPDQWVSTGNFYFPLRVHQAMSKDIVGCPLVWGGVLCYWHLMGRSYGGC